MIHSTTILAVRHRDRAVMAGDGQVTFGQTVVKQSARKIRRLYNDRILAGFAGSAADSFALFARFESKLEQFRGNLERSSVELAKDWRSDRILRRLEAMLVVLGQVTFGQTVVKQSARKIRRLYNDRILAGFAGSAADSFALFARFESKLEQFRGNLERSSVELAKDWRSDRILRRLEAMLVVLD